MDTRSRRRLHCRHYTRHSTPRSSYQPIQLTRHACITAQTALCHLSAVTDTLTSWLASRVIQSIALAITHGHRRETALRARAEGKTQRVEILAGRCLPQARVQRALSGGEELLVRDRTSRTSPDERTDGRVRTDGQTDGTNQTDGRTDKPRSYTKSHPHPTSTLC